MDGLTEQILPIHLNELDMVCYFLFWYLNNILIGNILEGSIILEVFTNLGVLADSTVHDAQLPDIIVSQNFNIIEQKPVLKNFCSICMMEGSIQHQKDKHGQYYNYHCKEKSVKIKTSIVPHDFFLVEQEPLFYCFLNDFI